MRARAAAKLTQAELARRLGTTQSAVCTLAHFDLADPPRGRLQRGGLRALPARLGGQTPAVLRRHLTYRVEPAA